MVIEQKDKTSILPPSSPSVTGERSTAPAIPTQQKPSIGERVWSGMTYTGLGYFANLAVSVVIADFFINGRGAPQLAKITGKTAGMLKGFGLSDASASNTAGAMMKYATLPFGGHLAIIPVKFSEDNARYITHMLNKKLDPNYEYRDLNVSWNSPETELPELVNEPNRNSWAQTAMRRGLGWGAVIATGALVGQERGDAIEKWTAGAMNKTLNATGSPSLQRLTQNPMYQRYMSITALDSYFTALTSVITAATAHTFGTAKDGGNGHPPGINHPSTPDTQVTIASAHTPNQAAVFNKEDDFQSLVASSRNTSALPAPGLSV